MAEREPTRPDAAVRTVVRGAMLGLLLGDAVGALSGNVPPDGPLHATSAGQLACFTAEGLIRASVRADHKGICHPPSVIWHAYRRWAAVQGIQADRTDRAGWPDGWLCAVPALGLRRGSAPATVAALRGGTMGTPEEPAGTSLGAHAVTRTLPVGLLASLSDPARVASEAAALSHCGDALNAAAVGALTLAHRRQGHPLDAAVRQAWASVPGPTLQPLVDALDAARDDPGDGTVLHDLAPHALATSALAGGVYVAASTRQRKDVRKAIILAANAGDGGHAATVAGALLGAVHGVDALPVDWVSRLELGWVGDTLANDLIAQVAEQPSGTGYSAAIDPAWWPRYPGW